MSVIVCGDVLDVLRGLPDEEFNCCVTSPPYWGLRDYGMAGQIGLEKTPEEYVARMVEVFREVRRVLRDDGTLWLNMGDSYTSGGRDTFGTFQPDSKQATHPAIKSAKRAPQPTGLKPKDLVGIPWRVAFALQADGWYLRSDIIWHKPNPMPESVTDRPTKAHEYLFLLAKSERYYYNAEAIKEATTGSAHDRGEGVNPKAKAFGPNSHARRDHDPAHQTEGRIRAKQNRSFSAAVTSVVEFRNKRSVWTIATQPYPEAHFATFPEDLVRPCILAGCPPGGRVLDPFAGSGTTLSVAAALQCAGVGIELNAEYCKLAEKRLAQEVLPLEVAQ